MFLKIKQIGFENGFLLLLMAKVSMVFKKTNLLQRKIDFFIKKVLQV
jgi:hypothetical protein